MSERERWVVYPLLFLALGVALRDKLLHRIELLHHVESREIVCRDLRIVGDQGRVFLRINADGLTADDQTTLRLRGAKLEAAEISAIDVLAENMAASHLLTSQLSISAPQTSRIVGRWEGISAEDPEGTGRHRSELYVDVVTAGELIESPADTTRDEGTD